MATKIKAKPQISQPTKDSSDAENGKDNILMEGIVMEEAGINQIVEEVPGTIDDVSAGAFDPEFSESNKHRPVSSPERRESVNAAATNTDPAVDAAFAKFSSLNDEREFWDILARAIGPQILNVMRRNGAKRIEASQTESASPQIPDQREFWGAIAGALAPVVMPYAKKAAIKAGKTGLSWLSRAFESSQQESGEELDGLALEFETILVQKASSASTESSNGSARDEREFWGFVARNIIPALSPLAKAAADATIRTGTKVVKGAVAKLTPQLISVLRREGFTESDIERLERAQESDLNGSTGDQREFWGAIAGAVVPALMPYAKKLAGAAVKTGGAWIRRRLESSQQESSQGIEAYAPLEELFVERATTSHESASISANDQREFWRAIARKVVPALAPIARAATTAATRAGTAWVRKMIFESSQHESGANGVNHLQSLEDLLVEEASLMKPRESGSMATPESEREFWGTIVRKLTPVLAPVAKSIATGALKTGTSMVTGTLRKLNARTANMLRVAGISEYAIQQLEAGDQSTQHVEPEVNEREFWRSIARTIVPLVKPIAHKLGKTAVSAGGKLISDGISSLFESGRESTTEGIKEAFAQQMEALEVIIGEDDRVQITTTTQSPFNRICHLSITAGDGSSFLGTGFFIGPRTIITAGHCVYDPDHGGWPQHIVVSPGRNGTDKPFGHFVATKFGSVEGWTERQDRDCDYGVIHLSENDRAPAQIGSFGYGIFSDGQLANTRLHIAGYPGDKPSGTMMFHSREATDVSSTTVVYDIDTVGGQSGSPVYDENRRVVAIHTNGSSSGNSATRITLPVFTNLSQWRLDGD